MALVRRLVKEGHDVASFSRNSYSQHIELGVKSFTGDISNPAHIFTACKDIEAVFHTAAKVGFWGTYADFYKTNVSGTENLINSCISNGVGRLIFTSSASVVFDGTHLEGINESVNYPLVAASNYTATKAIAEQMVLQANSGFLRTISLRPHLVWGPGDTQLIPKMIQRAESGKLRRPGKRDYFIDTTYIDNLIDAQLLALDKMELDKAICGKPFFITDGKPVKSWDFINSILMTAGVDPIKKTFPKAFALAVAWIIEKTNQLLKSNKDPFISRFLIHELCTHHWFDISAARSLLGYQPAIGFNEGIRRLKQEFCSVEDNSKNVP